jgi:hypothetical protein
MRTQVYRNQYANAAIEIAMMRMLVIIGVPCHLSQIYSDGRKLHSAIPRITDKEWRAKVHFAY